MQTLPAELFEDITSLALALHPVPHAIARVNSAWAGVALPLLHAKIHITSPRQLHLFALAHHPLCCAIRGREVEVRLPGGTEGRGVWGLLREALRRCHQPSSCCRGVRVLRLCLNSHMYDANVHLVSEALGLSSPEVFAWTGPDPDHHFSTAIVPPATHELCTALPSWSSLRRLELSNISFLHNSSEFAHALLQLFPGPRTIFIRQAVFLQPSAVLQIVQGVWALDEFWLVDVYVGSIWGARLRRGDVETLLEGDDAERWEGRIGEVVRCVAKTERLMGGDRGER